MPHVVLLTCWYADLLICWHADLQTCWHAHMLTCCHDGSDHLYFINNGHCLATFLISQLFKCPSYTLPMTMGAAIQITGRAWPIIWAYKILKYYFVHSFVGTPICWITVRKYSWGILFTIATTWQIYYYLFNTFCCCEM